jgi:hypothetical protein
MASEAQIAANRLNAQKSTGPKTAQGKAAVARNPLRHGMTAETVVLFDELEAEFEAFHKGLISDLRPRGTTECSLVERIAILGWRLRRASRAEAAMINAEAEYRQERIAVDGPHRSRRLDASMIFDRLGHDMSRLTRYEVAVERQLNRAMAILDLRQARRFARGEHEPVEPGDRPPPEPDSTSSATSPKPGQGAQGH